MSSQRGTCWSLTINNPNTEDLECMKNPTGHKDFISCEGQQEIGENGTPHLQLMLKTKSMKFSAVKKLFPRAHIELARSANALQKYVHKDETRVGTIEPTRVATVATLNTAMMEVWPTIEEVDDYLENMTDDEMTRAGILILDKIAHYLIRKGYYGIEYIAANPSVRTTWKLFYNSIVYRQYNARQEDVSQTQGGNEEAQQSAQSAERNTDSEHSGDNHI